ncbi:IS110 family transposase [Bradyrhizobium sp. SSUT112]|uniref:IS110 family transposase n=1 Tax=Bradyrhizobium sp. SSUT112 TaxID=3040604 RepID=UPI00244709D2|nr:IS110 family transposase [Bradyrhizobium sp. SSUT112]MDH2357514.1 IS110 family transposase [Bradyrhizobium sp. SSUT112]
MEKIITLGLDLAKSIFQVHGVAENGEVLVRRTLRRSQVRGLPACLVGMEACASAYHRAREIAALGHSVRLMPPAYVKPYVKRNKTDAADAEAICEAATRPTMRFVPVKTAEQQAASMALRTREMLMRQRSQTANALRGHMAELGIIAGTGMTSITKLLVLLRDEKDRRIPGAARFALIQFPEQIELLTTRIEKLDKEILVAVRQDPDARRVMSIPGVGPLIAATVRTSVPDASAFATARDFAAWAGLTPRAQSSGGKDRLGAISKRGNRQLRTLLIVGATSIVKLAKRGLKVPLWVRSALQRRPVKVISVALANKIARTIWALLVKGGIYQAPAAMLKS